MRPRDAQLSDLAVPDLFPFAVQDIYVHIRHGISKGNLFGIILKYRKHGYKGRALRRPVPVMEGIALGGLNRHKSLSSHCQMF